MRLSHFGFLLAFALGLLPLAAVRLGAAGVPCDLAAWFPLFFIFVMLPLADAACGVDTVNVVPSAFDEFDRSRFLRALPALALPVWLAVFAYCVWQMTHLALGPLGLLGWLLSAGVLGGVLAITPAHELIHKAGGFERVCGGLLLTSVGYHGFKIEHVRGHHVHVATPLDSSSARLGESVYGFVPRALRLNLRNAWRLEAARLRSAGATPWSPRNEMLRWSALWLLMLAGFGAWLGFAAVPIVVAIGAGAAASLEVINYIEHYGLQRAEIAPGRYARVTHRHSWNASQRLSNWLLFNLQRHSDHHAHARKRYAVLDHHDDSPQLPAGYATLFVLALLPPLWHRVMDERARQAGSIDAGLSPSE